MQCFQLNFEDLREHAFRSLSKGLDERNLLQELASGLAGRYDLFRLYNGSLFQTNGRYPRILEMELDLLSQRIATAPIAEGLPALMKRISQNQLPHGADIMIGLLTRTLRLHYANGLASWKETSGGLKKRICNVLSKL